MRLTAAQVASYARGAGFPEDQVVMATAVALAEHRGNVDTDALGDTTITTATWGPSVGIWQIRSLTPTALAKETNAVDRLRVQAKLTDPAYNAAAARAIWGARGWQPWSTYPAISLLYMPTAKAAAAQSPAAVGQSSPAAAGSIQPVVYQPVGLLDSPAAGVLSLPLGIFGASDVLGTASNAVGLLGSIVAFLAKAAAWIGNRANWMRIARVLIGSWMVLLGLLMFGWPALNAAASFVPAGKAAKAAGTVKAGAGKAKAAGAAAAAANQGV